MSTSILVTQTYKVTRSILVVADDDDSASALESVASGSIDTPEFSDPDWREGWTLQDQWEDVVT